MNETDDKLRDQLKTSGGLDVLNDLAPVIDLSGERVGDYVVGELLGEGGMARVFRGRRADGQFDKEVAIKLVLHDSGEDKFSELVRRERQILAGLNHPGIAQLFDSGVTDGGFPYMVMELVEGTPADQYCRDHILNTAARVALAIQIAEAVGHAHSHLVVHRDIKPSNVLVTVDGQPKLLDFGIAKWLQSEDEAATRTQALTPGFASPELMLGHAISIRSDVYQLGLLLLHMLADHPLEQESWADAVVRVSRGGALRFNRAVVAELPGDLWMVIEKCLRQDVEQRYPDVNALCADLRRYLQGYPVEARAPSPLYHVGKFVRRNRMPVSLVSSALLALAAATVWYVLEVTSARELAERRAETASRVTSTLTRFINDTFTQLIRESAAVNRDGPSQFIRASLANTAKVLEADLALEPEAQAQALGVQGSLEQLLGDVEAAERTHLRRLELLDATQPSLLLETHLDLVHLYSQANDIQVARQELAAAEQQAASFVLNDTERLDLLSAQAAFAAQNGDFERANVHYGEVATLLESTDEVAVLPRLRSYATLASHNSAQSNFEETLNWSARAIELAEDALSPDSYELIQPLQAAGWAHRMAGEFDQALSYQQRALDLALANFGPVHPEVADLHNAMGAIRYSLQEMDVAVDHFLASLDVSRQLFGERHLNVAGNHSNVGLVLLYGGRVAEAVEHYQTSIGIARELGSQGERALATVLRNMAYVRSLMGEWQQAEATYEEALAVRQRVFGDDSSLAREAMIYFSEFLSDRGQHVRAAALFEQGISGMRAESPADDVGLKSWEVMAWKIVLAQGDEQRARQMLEEKVVYSGEQIEYRSIFSTFELTELAQLCLRLNDLICAEQKLTQAEAGVEIAPQHAHALFHAAVRAQLLKRQGQTQAAAQLAAATRAKVLAHYPLRNDLLALLK